MRNGRDRLFLFCLLRCLYFPFGHLLGRVFLFLLKKYRDKQTLFEGLAALATARAPAQGERVFELLAQDSVSKARRGRLTTAHGLIDTPAFIPVGTQGSVKAMTPRELRELNAQIVLGNTYHLFV